MVEPAQPIRLIALDIDGTLVGENLVIGHRTRAAIAEARRRGIAVSLLTGRMVTSALDFARELELTSPVVGLQGAVVRSMPLAGSTGPGRLLYHRPLRPEVTTRIVRWCAEHDLTPHFNYLEWMIVGADESRIEDYKRIVGDRIRLVPDVAARAAAAPVTKIVAIGDGEHSVDLLEEARAYFAGLASVTISHPMFLEFLATGVSKGHAVRWLARRLRVPLSQAIAIGDQFNDLEMIGEVGHGVAMPSAPEEVKAVARYVAPPVSEEGAAQMIERIALDGGLHDGGLHDGGAR